MPTSRKKKSNAADVLAWLAQSNAIPDRREAALRFIKAKTLEAFERQSYELLPAATDVGAAMGLSRNSLNQLLLQLVDEGTLGRLRFGCTYRYYVTEEWLS